MDRRFLDVKNVIDVDRRTFVSTSSKLFHFITDTLS
jgi:hypothetical protein